MKDLIKVKDLVLKQRNYFASQATKNVVFRIDTLKKLQKAIVHYQARIMKALYLDLHKSEFEAYSTEISMVLSELKVHINKLKTWAKPHKVGWSVLNPFSISSLHPEPHGTVLIIAPWNYPFQLLVLPLIGAISAGNCVVLKGAELAPHTVAVVAEMIEKTFDNQYIGIVEGGKEMNEALLAQKFDYIFFTGSPSLGKIVMQAAANFLTPVTLELGGKSPTIVDEDADIELATRRIVWGKLINCGQTCIAPDYFLVHVKIKDKFVDYLKKHIIEFYGMKAKESPDYPRMINAHHFNRAKNLVQSGIVVYGGSTDESDLFIEPTIIEDFSLNSPLMQEEIFAPLFPILEFKQLQEAIDLINSRPKPLALYYFSKDNKKQKEVIKKTSSGGVCINDTIMHITNHHLPFGGAGNSGMGAYHGKFSFMTFSHYKSVMKQSTLIDIPLRYPPFNLNKLGMMKKIM